MQEHGDKRREPIDWIVVDDTRPSVAERDAGSEPGLMRDLTRYQAEVADAGGELLLVEAAALHKQPDPDKSRQYRIRHDRRTQCRVVVAEWNHLALEW